jgi:hypothetical protein
MDLDHLGRQYLPTPGWDEPKAGRAWRQQLLVMLAIVAALTVMSAQLWWPHISPPDTFDPPRFNDLTPATTAQGEELQRIVLAYREVSIDARLSGDTSAFAAYLYNDPHLDTWPECAAVFADYADEIDRRLSSGQTGPVNATRGLLSCEVGGVIRAWEYATVRATADAALPYPDGGYTPAMFMRRQVGPRTTQTTYFHQPMISSTGQHATLAESFYPDPGGPTYLHYVFTLVNGHWYISAMWSDCRADMPCA